MNYLDNDWGIKILAIRIKNVKIDKESQKIITMVTKAEEDIKAKILYSKSEEQIADQNVKASEIYENNPFALKIREYQLLDSIAKNPNTTIILPNLTKENNLGIITKIKEQK